MLSDGAGALLITPTPRPDALSLRIDWVDIASYASESDVCMYFGLQKHADGRTSSFRTVDNEGDLFRGGYLSLTQDIRVLNERLPQLMRAAFDRLLERHSLAALDLNCDNQIEVDCSETVSFEQPIKGRTHELRQTFIKDSYVLCKAQIASSKKIAFIVDSSET